MTDLGEQVAAELVAAGGQKIRVLWDSGAGMLSVTAAGVQLPAALDVVNRLAELTGEPGDRLFAVNTAYGVALRARVRPRS